MKRPAFQFYPGDWQRNANLRRCSPAARGVWVDVLCLLHDSDEYGLLRWPLKEIAQAAGASMAHVRELVDKSVLKGVDKGPCEPFIFTPRSGRKDGEPVTLVATQAGPIWYSSRMVKDEYVRTIRGESSRFGETLKPPPKYSPKPPFGDGSSSASATAVLKPEQATESLEAGAQAEAVALASAEGLQPTPAGRICGAMRRAGLQQTNPGDPRFLALIQHGATEAEFVGIAAEAVSKGIANGWGWTLKVLEARRAEASQIELARPATDPAHATVPSAAPVETAAYIASQDAARQAASSPETIAAREAAMAKIRGAVKTLGAE